MSLLDEQIKFSQMYAKLLQKAEELGYGVTQGEGYRTPEQAAWNAQHGIGIRHSLHILRLAHDINLIKDGAYQKDPKEYEALGEWWESIGGSWGGRFGDANHFSLSYGGVK